MRQLCVNDCGKALVRYNPHPSLRLASIICCLDDHYVLHGFDHALLYQSYYNKYLSPVAHIIVYALWCVPVHKSSGRNTYVTALQVGFCEIRIQIQIILFFIEIKNKMALAKSYCSMVKQ